MCHNAAMERICEYVWLSRYWCLKGFDELGINWYNHLNGSTNTYQNEHELGAID